MGNVRGSSFLLASTAGITLKQPDDGGVALGSLDEFLKGQFTWKTQTHFQEFLFLNLCCQYSEPFGLLTC